MEDRYDTLITDSFRAINRANVFDGIYSPIILVTQAAVVAVIMAGAALGPAWADLFGLSVGSAVAVIAYVGKSSGPWRASAWKSRASRAPWPGSSILGNSWTKRSGLL